MRAGTEVDFIWGHHPAHGRAVPLARLPLRRGRPRARRRRRLRERRSSRSSRGRGSPGRVRNPAGALRAAGRRGASRHGRLLPGLRPGLVGGDEPGAPSRIRARVGRLHVPVRVLLARARGERRVPLVRPRVCAGPRAGHELARLGYRRGRADDRDAAVPRPRPKQSRQKLWATIYEADWGVERIEPGGIAIPAGDEHDIHE